MTIKEAKLKNQMARIANKAKMKKITVASSKILRKIKKVILSEITRLFRNILKVRS